MRVHLYYDPVKAAKDREALPDKKLRSDSYFYINRSIDGKSEFCRNCLYVTI